MRRTSDLKTSLISAEQYFRDYVGKYGVYHMRIHNCLRYLDSYSTYVISRGKIAHCQRGLAISFWPPTIPRFYSDMMSRNSRSLVLLCCILIYYQENEGKWGVSGLDDKRGNGRVDDFAMIDRSHLRGDILPTQTFIYTK